MDVFETNAVWQDAPSLSNTTSPQPTQQEFFPSTTHDFTSTSKNDPFNDFDDFGDTTEAKASEQIDDDDFGDFGDFTQESMAPEALGQDGLDEDGFGFSDNIVPGVSLQSSWSPLHLDPMPNEMELSQQTGILLSGIVNGPAVDSMLTGEGIKQVDSSTQLLVTPESRTLYKTLFEVPAPSLRAPNWTRSKIRRNHLITLGIPVNLDEVNPQSNGRALPTLNIITRPSSTPSRPGSRQGTRSHPSSRAGTPTRNSTSIARNVIQSLGTKPELDETKIEMLLSLDPDNLPLQPIAKLESHIAALRSQTVSASSLLSYLLQSRDALQQESELYNKKIAEMVNEAQKLKLGSKKQTVKRGA